MGAANSKGEHWQRDSEALECHRCRITFSVTTRRHHCRNCGYVFCGNCSNYSCRIPMRGMQTSVRVCGDCFHTLRKDVNNNNSLHNDFYTGTPRESSEAYCLTNGGILYESHIDPNMGVNNNWENDATQFIGSGMGANTKGASTDDTEAYYDNYQKTIDNNNNNNTANSHTSDEKTSDQVEKERLVQRWMEVRQHAIFIDILLQHVERVEAKTEVDYCAEAETIMLQPEAPDNLRIMFPFPQAKEGNVEFLIKPVSSSLLVQQEKSKAVEDALKKLASQLILPPVTTMKKNDSVLLRQF